MKSRIRLEIARYGGVFLLGLGLSTVLLAAIPVSGAAETTRREMPGDAKLVNQANAPISSILQIRFKDTFVPSFVHHEGRGNFFIVDVTMPLPAYRLLPIRHLTLLSAPVAVTTPGERGETGFGDLRFMDLVIAYENRKFVLGAGPVFVLPTATERLTGQGKWQVGPAAGAAVISEKWMGGIIFQNPISFAGDEDRPYANAMLLQPFVTCQLGKGWFLRSQPQMIFDWRTEDKILPVDLGAGRTFVIGGQAVSCFVQSFWNFHHGGHPPQYGVTAGITFLFPNFWDKFSEMRKQKG